MSESSRREVWFSGFKTHITLYKLATGLYRKVSELFHNWWRGKGPTVAMDRRTPVVQPLRTCEEVLQWEPGCNPDYVASLPKRQRVKKDQPKTLVCHDMKGGYLEDRFIQGCMKMDAYRFYYWHYVDTFVYFSHYFITIPPPCWTNAAHRHGVSMLGTFITEWDDGKASCKQILESKESFEKFADKLVHIAKYYGFDGWLINVENVIESKEDVENLAKFVAYLTKEVHKHIPGSEVIWYDSVINTGELDWQNALNEKNRMFFDVCDGMFLNYCWKDEDLEKSRKMAEDAKRPFDVYVGIDVFGRGCLGDGGMNTCEALEAVRKHELSAAIFGQGWVHERLEAGEDFTAKENKFWQLLHHLCYEGVYSSLPLSTSFCQGFGERFFDQGIPVGNTWWNMNVQQLQPNCTQAQFAENTSYSLQYHFPSHCPFPPSSPFSPARPSMALPAPGTPMEWSPSVYKQDEPPTMEPYSQEAFNGGSCLKLQGDVAYTKFVKFSLFNLDVNMRQHASVYVSLTYRIIQDPDCDVFLELHLQEEDQSKVLVLMPFPHSDKPVPAFEPPTACQYVQPLKWEELPRSLQLTPPPAANTRWRTRWFQVCDLDAKTCKLAHIYVCLTTTDPVPKTCIALLGDLKVLPISSIPEVFPRAEFVSVEVDTSPLYPLLDASKNEFDKPRAPLKPEDTIDCTDPTGNTVTMTYGDIMKVRISSNTLKELRQGHNGQMFEVMYQLITSLDCFKVHWKTDLPELIDHYSVYQIKIDSGVAKLLGHVTEPFFKVTWFEIPDYQKSEIAHHFKFVVRPVLRSGIAVPLDYNYCTLFHVVSRKTSAALVTETGSGELTAEAESSSEESDTSETEGEGSDSEDESSDTDKGEDDKEKKIKKQQESAEVQVRVNEVKVDKDQKSTEKKVMMDKDQEGAEKNVKVDKDQESAEKKVKVDKDQESAEKKVKVDKDQRSSEQQPKMNEKLESIGKQIKATKESAKGKLNKDQESTMVQEKGDKDQEKVEVQLVETSVTKKTTEDKSASKRTGDVKEKNAKEKSVDESKDEDNVKIKLAAAASSVKQDDCEEVGNRDDKNVPAEGKTDEKRVKDVKRTDISELTEKLNISDE